MRRPAEPHYSFTIPSVHDDTTLDCRIYHPDVLSGQNAGRVDDLQTQWKKRGIVMAHPYAPMGGSYDDRVVGIVVDEFVRAEWIVGTFNFRGAHGSKGRSSWSGRPELDDYVSFAALFMHYMSYILPQQTQDAPIVTLAGYSYGSLILKHLPPIPTILQPFAAPLTGSAADEILSRARNLSKQSNLEWQRRAEDQERERRSRIKGHKTKPSMTMGGEEISPEKRRSSRDIRRSIDGRLSVDLGNRLRSISHRGRKHEGPSTPPEHRDSIPITVAEVRYLLVSPLAGPISILAAPALGAKPWSRREVPEDSIGHYPTLAVYGDQDIFTSAKKTRDWGQKLKAAHDSCFSIVEVAGAGHFWAEHGVEEELRTALRDWEVTMR